jgi:hypothetical protein
MTDIRKLHAELMHDPAYRREYVELEDEFALLRATAEAWAKARLASGLQFDGDGAPRHVAPLK